MYPEDHITFSFKGALTWVSSLSAAFTCGVMTWNASGDDPVGTFWWPTWLLLVAIVFFCSYLIVRGPGSSIWTNLIFTLLFVVAQFGATALIILWSFSEAGLQ